MPQRSYIDDPVGAPTAILELMPGVRNLMKYLAVKAGEEVLILAEYSVDPTLIQAIGAAAAFIGSRVSVLTVEPNSPGGFNRQIPGPIPYAAWDKADVVILLEWYGLQHTKPLFFTVIKKMHARMVTSHMSANGASYVTGARFPPELFYAIKKRTLDITVGSEEIRLWTARGTDLTFRKNTFDTDNGPIDKPGAWSPFPYGGVNWYPDQTDGVAVIEESTVTGVPSEPLKLHFRDNLLVDIEGGTERRDLEVFSPGGYYMRHAFIGMNPKVRLKAAPQFEREKHAGNFYFGIDAAGASDRQGPGYSHCDCQFDRCTITVDGKTLVDRGYLTVLDDPTLREEVRAYGDPDRLLVPNPYLW